MKHVQIIGLLLSAGLVMGLSGCSMGNDHAAPTPTPGSSAAPSASPQTSTSGYQVQDILDHMQANDYTLTQIAPIDNVDFNALEGVSFQYNNQVYYLYRFDPANEESQKMLDYARTHGKMKVSVNGQEAEYQAYTNGDTVLIYDSQQAVEDLREIYSQFQTAADPVS